MQRRRLHFIPESKINILHFKQNIIETQSGWCRFSEVRTETVKCVGPEPSPARLRGAAPRVFVTPEPTPFPGRLPIVPQSAPF